MSRKPKTIKEKLLKWGPQAVEVIVPQGFVLLCSLTEKDAGYILTQFMRDLCADGSSHNKEARALLKEYFFSHRYHQPSLSRAEVEGIFHQLESLSSLWPKGGNEELIKLHLEWRRGWFRFTESKWKKEKRGRAKATT